MTPLFLLDRNAISVIKNKLANKAPVDPKKLALLATLEHLNQSGNHISPLLSIVEGEHGREDTVDEKAACVITEATAVRNFFDQATTDADQLLRDPLTVARVFTTYRETGWENRSSYWASAAPLVKGGIAKEKRRGVEDELVALATANGLPSDDPIHLLFLAALHGGASAQDVLKLRSDSAYNPLNDLHVLSRMALIQAVATNAGHLIMPVLVSMDEGLNDVLSHTHFSKSKLTDEGGIHMTLRFDKELFPQLSDKEYRALLDRAKPNGDV
ncbi:MULTISPECIES: hypothetical protein [unclassified Luteibacter]|uniref:hypothetical protein n=1 Tax=Luteibacter sp. PvP019 TaxID=3156436 RepID=UPI00339B983F